MPLTLARLVDQRLKPVHVALPAGVTLNPDHLHDDADSADLPINATAHHVLQHLLNDNLSVGDTCARMAEQYPGTPADTDTLRLVAELNAAGVLNVGSMTPRYQPLYGGFADTIRHAVVRVWHAVLQSTFTRRAEFVLPRQIGSLALFVGFSLRFFLVLLLAVATMIGTVAGPGLVLDTAIAIALFVVSVAVHEVAHATAAGSGPAFVVGSTTGVRVVVRDGSSRRLAVAAMAGPAAGLAVSIVGLYVGAVLEYPAILLTSAVVALTNAWCLLPWSPDGRVLNHALRHESSQSDSPLQQART